MQAFESAIPRSCRYTRFLGDEGDYLAIKRSVPVVDFSISLAELPPETCSVQVTLDSDPLEIAFDDVISYSELMILRDMFFLVQTPPLNRVERAEFVLDRYWNPIGIPQTREPFNEYTRYANRIVVMQDAGDDRYRIIEYLRNVQLNSLGLTSNDDRLDYTASALSFVASSGFNNFTQGSTNNPMDRSGGSTAS
jgi:hypothetical protein